MTRHKDEQIDYIMKSLTEGYFTTSTHSDKEDTKMTRLMNIKIFKNGYAIYENEALMTAKFTRVQSRYKTLEKAVEAAMSWWANEWSITHIDEMMPKDKLP